MVESRNVVVGAAAGAPRGAATLFGMLAVLPMLGSACTSPPRSVPSTTSEQMLALLMPTRIEIVKPSTRLRSPSGSGKPEALELLVRGYTLLENPGALLVGQVRVELFTFQPASANNKGQRITAWEIALDDQEQQERFWNPVIQMYEFQLGIDAALIPPAEKYVLSVTYNTPLGQHLSDEIVFELLAGAGAVTRPPASGGS